MRRDLPSGTVTFLFTDVEGSSKLLHDRGAEAYAEALAGHRRVLREAFARHGGVEVDTQGDAFFAVFPTATGALEAAREAQEALVPGPIRARMGLHTGTPHLTEEGYVGQDVHRGARIAAAGHGGQVLLSSETRAFVDVPVTDLGEHRLKGLEEPVWIFQVGSVRFPPLRTISNTNLPRPASRFVGRGKEVADIVSLLRDGARLLTLTGPGGSGKTRLAIEAAAELVPEFQAGVFWIDLAPLRDATLVTDAMAQALGAKEPPAVHIGTRQLLLLIDNFEQVIDAAPLLSALVEACPNLRLLVTSREILRVRGEVEYPIPPLAEPEAVELFCARSRAEPDETVYALCRALDRLPLALELAAARTGVLSPREILERLSGGLDLLKGGRDAGPRQKTLRATTDWSYELLSMEEKRLFARISVFAGGCTLDAAETVAGADLDVLQSLVDKSLLTHTGERHSILETIREYAAERLAGSDEGEDVRRRHADYFLAVAEEAEPHLRGSPGEWLDRLRREKDNLRAALDRFEASGESQRALRLAGALWRFWYLSGALTEGRRRLERALLADTRPTAARANALNGAAVMAVNGGDPATARLRAEEGIELHHKLGDAWGAAYSGFMLGAAVDSEGDFARAQQLFEESIRQFRALGDQHSALLATRNLAGTYASLGDRERARALREDNLRLARETGNRRIEASSLGALAASAIDEGRIEDAASMLKESLRLHRDLGDLLDTAVDICRFAYVLASEGRAATAARLLSSFEALGEEIGTRRLGVAEMNKATLASIRAQIDDAGLTEAREHGQALTVDEAVALALDSA